jgi:CubicO group peptidase (beta-lactamase class C family)
MSASSSSKVSHAMDRRVALKLLVGGAGSLALSARGGLEAEAADSTRIGALVERFMKEFEIPGVGIAIVRPGQPDFVQGYGVRTLGQPALIDAHTQFAIASNTKAFLTACLALLVDSGKLRWDDPVIQYLPQFQMYDEAVTRLMTVRDLLVHRSGLPLGAGDLMQFPPGDHTAQDLLHALRYFKPATGFRAGYAYDNILYIVAGMLLEQVSGLSWDRYISTRLFEPLGMANAVSNPTLVRGANRTGRHARLGPPIIGMGKLEVVAPAESALIAPAGGINASISDAVPWLKVQLGRGALPDGRRLWSTTQADEMWKPQTIVSSGPGPGADRPQRSVMQGYALGWGVSEYRQRRMLAHAGGVVGQISRTTLFPDDGIGFVVYSNTGDEDPISGLRYALADHLLGAPEFDWVAATRNDITKVQAQVMAAVGTGDFKAPPGGLSIALDRYVGRYRDPWYGDIVITRDGELLRVNFTHTPIFKSALEPFGPDSFRTRFPRGAGEDALLHFAVQEGQVAGISLKALSPLADFSFDFQDLAFVPVRP